MNLVDAALIEILGRRGVLHMPDRQAGAFARGIFQHDSAYAFASDVTLQDINVLVEAGAVVEVVNGPIPEDALPPAAVAANGTVNLQPGIRTPETDDTRRPTRTSPTRLIHRQRRSQMIRQSHA